MTGVPPSAPGDRTVVVAGTFTLDPVTRAAAWWLARKRPDAHVIQAPYGQLLELVHDPNSPLHTNAGVNVLLLRTEDLLREPDDAGLAVSDRADAIVAELVRILPRVPDASRATWLVGFTPSSPRLADGPAASWVEQATARLIHAVRGADGLHLLDFSALERLYQVDAVHDEYGDRHGHLPYTDEYLVAVGTWLARVAESVWARPRKVIVLDCDNTLWSGVCGEDGPSAVVISPAHRYLQRFMREQRRAGRLLCLCSRNEEADVLAVFTREDMELPIAEIAGRRIGWGAKPVAIAELAGELGLALDSVIFVDDDPVECGLVRDQLPDVAVVQVPADPDLIAGVLDHEWAFDQFVTTEDDLWRADRYAEERRRRAARSASEDYQDFLRRCGTVLEFIALDDASLPRAAQLTSRTTQFNLTGEVFSVPDLREFLREGMGWTVRARDRFGDYGTVALVLLERGDTALRVRLLLMSCRVLNRGIEQELVSFISDRAAEAGMPAVELPYRHTRRNTPARLFLRALSGESIAPPAGTVTLSLTRAGHG